MKKITFNEEYDNLRFNIYKIEVGVLLTEDEECEDYDCYNDVYDKQYGYYDENVTFELDYNKALDRTNKLLELQKNLQNASREKQRVKDMPSIKMAI